MPCSRHSLLNAFRLRMGASSAHGISCSASHFLRAMSERYWSSSTVSIANPRHIWRLVCRDTAFSESGQSCPQSAHSL